jgi:hypothetical protein
MRFSCLLHVTEKTTRLVRVVAAWSMGPLNPNTGHSTRS